jgi:hypothetical protein
MPICVTCRHRIPDAARFCPICGSRQSHESAPHTVTAFPPPVPEPLSDELLFASRAVRITRSRIDLPSGHCVAIGNIASTVIQKRYSNGLAHGVGYTLVGLALLGAIYAAGLANCFGLLMLVAGGVFTLKGLVMLLRHQRWWALVLRTSGVESLELSDRDLRLVTQARNAIHLAMSGGGTPAIINWTRPAPRSGLGAGLAGGIILACVFSACLFFWRSSAQMPATPVASVAVDSERAEEQPTSEAVAVSVRPIDRAPLPQRTNPPAFPTAPTPKLTAPTPLPSLPASPRRVDPFQNWTESDRTRLRRSVQTLVAQRKVKSIEVAPGRVTIWNAYWQEQSPQQRLDLARQLNLYFALEGNVNGVEMLFYEAGRTLKQRSYYRPDANHIEER